MTESSAFSIENPYGQLTGGKWLKGNLHAHTTHSDGKAEPQEVLNRYAEIGHDFLMISDHDIFTSSEDHAKWDAKGLILIPGNEISRNGPHVLHVNANCRIEPDILRQRVILEANKAGGFIIVAHPNWQAEFNHCSIQKLSDWIDYTGMEIYNGVISRLSGSPYATNKWDMLLSAGRRVWGFANDDSHRPETDIGLGWNVAYVTDESVAGVVDALASGRFYGSTGVEITDIAVNGRTISIKTSNARRVVALTQVGQRVATSNDNHLEFEVSEQSKYIRFECWGDGEQFAWTQPFYCNNTKTK